MDSMDFVTLYRAETAALTARLERRRMAEEVKAQRPRGGRLLLRGVAHRAAKSVQQH